MLSVVPAGSCTLKFGGLLNEQHGLFMQFSPVQRRSSTLAMLGLSQKKLSPASAGGNGASPRLLLSQGQRTTRPPQLDVQLQMTRCVYVIQMFHEIYLDEFPETTKMISPYKIILFS